MFQFIPRGRAHSRACTSQQGQSPRGRPVTREARGAGWGGGVDRAGPERLSPGRRPGREQLPAAPTMAAAAVGQVGSRPRVWGLGNGEGRRTSGRTTRSQPVRLGAVSLALGFRCEAPRKRGGPLGKEHRSLVEGGREAIGGKETGTGGLRKETWRKGQ